MRDDRLHSCLYKFQVRVFNALKKVAQPALDVEFQTIDLDNSTPASRERIAELMEANMKVANYKSYTPEDVQRAILASFRIGESYITTGFGTRRDLAKGLPYLSASARKGRLLSLLHFTIIDSSVGSPDANGVVPRRLWLILNASAGSLTARSLITKHYPELVDLMNFLIRAPGGVCGRLRRSYWTQFEDPEDEVRYLRETPADELDPMYHYQSLGRNPLYYAVGFGCQSKVVKAILEDGCENEDLETALLIAAQGGQGKLVSLLLDNGAKGTARDPKNGATALHYLALIGDDILGDLASRLVTSASQLSVQASPQQPVASETMSVLQGSPILWACMMNNTTLFASLLRLHNSFKAPIVESKMLIEFAVECHLDSILSMAFEDDSPLKDSITSDTEYLDHLLTIALRGPRMVHCNFHMQDFPEAEQKTIDLLLGAGADPSRYSGESDPFDIVIRGDFLNAFKRLVAAVEKRGVDPKTILQDTRRFNGKTALETSICTAGWDIFCFILDNNLGSLDDTFRSGDQNALHISASIGDVRFIDPILNADVSPLLFTSTGYRPFDFAIIAQNLDFARTLYNSYKDREKFLAEDDRGFSTFSRLVYGSRTVYRNVIDMDAIRLIIELGGFTEYYSTVSGDSNIRELSKAPYSFTRPDNVAFDISLLKEVLDRTSAELINETDSHGLAPLHYMVLNSNFEGVKEMIYNEKVDINVPAGTPSDITQEFLDLGDMPLDICAQVRHSPDPMHVRQGGSREVTRYRRNVEEIITLLLQKGAKESKGYFLQMQLKDAMGIPDFLKISSGPFGNQKWYGPQRWIEDSGNAGVWPMKLGHAVDNIQNVTVETEEIDPVWLL
jgi:ankyrin repeat protein